MQPYYLTNPAIKISTRLTHTLKTASIFILVSVAMQVYAQRIPVLNQIDLPHNYYYRELYLPQLTSGPSSACWLPDGNTVVFSMAGSLWKQKINSHNAEQLTDANGYDYQPDCSPDGRLIIFVRYNGASTELMLLDLQTLDTFALTNNHAVNLEPRWSPDGKEILFVSTANTRHFLLYKAAVSNNTLNKITCLTPERKSNVKRYYYSAYDHAINPAWSADGKKVYFVYNHEVAHGTGNIVCLPSDKSDTAIIVHKEETAWNIRPDISPDGSRMVYSSYLGGNFQQLWMLPANGGYPMPLTYGEFDNTYPRWSPDGKKIIFISNREGNTSLWLLNTYDGWQQKIVAETLIYLRPHKKIFVWVRDETGNPLPARISITDESEKFYAPRDTWIQADDSRYADQRKYETHYFHSTGVCELSVPEGKLNVTASHGPLYEIATIATTTTQRNDTIVIALKKLSLPDSFGNWWSGDLHVHMNYGGHYQNTPSRLVKQAACEDVNFVYNLIVNKEQRIPDIKYFSTKPDNASTAGTILLHAQEFHTSFWGHLGLLHLSQHYILPDYGGYPQTAVESIFPNNSFIADRAHEQNGLAGYAHPFDSTQIYPEQSAKLTNELPVDAALHKVDYYELIGFAEHKASEAVWYKLLNCGLHIPAAAGTDAMANYASLRGPLGLNRLYVKNNGPLNENKFLNDVKSGKSFVTNGPVINLEVEGAVPGDSITIDPNGQPLHYTAFLRSNFSVDSFEIVFNGDAIAHLATDKSKKSADVNASIQVKSPGWLLLRAWSRKADINLPDLYPYASTNPIYISMPFTKMISRSAAAFFLHWVDRLATIAGENKTYRNEEEKKAVLNDIEIAKRFYASCLQNATAP